MWTVALSASRLEAGRFSTARRTSPAAIASFSAWTRRARCSHCIRSKRRHVLRPEGKAESRSRIVQRRHTMTDLQALFDQIDIYLFDQLLRGRIPPGTRICDAGCGSGRNLVYFLREGYDVRAVDAERSAVDGVRALAERLAADLPAEN